MKISNIENARERVGGADISEADADTKVPKGTMKFALIGNPNSGKTTLFNTLTGSSAHVGNWPGVTVEKKEGTYKKLPEKITVVDLPGIYSLSPYTPEEIVSRNFLTEAKPDAVINIVDATNLERNLYLTTQLLEADVPVIIALNMMDAAEKDGTKINSKELEKALKVPVAEISALKNRGIAELMARAYECAKTPRAGDSVLFDMPPGKVLEKVAALLKEEGADNALYRAVKIIEGDEPETKANAAAAVKISALKSGYKSDDLEAEIAGGRYAFITNLCGIAAQKSGGAEKVTRSDKIDRVMTHRVFGIPIFLCVMFVVFHFTFSQNFLFLTVFGLNEGIPSPGVFLQSVLGMLTGGFIEIVSGWLESAPLWVSGLIVDGLLTGLDAVLSFLPQILLLFLFLSLLEDSGYMARVAFIMDRAFRRFGLSGKAFMPLLMCFGCAVPGIMATRTLENEKERRMTVMLAPFFSCGAKLPIWAVFGTVMFSGQYGDIVVFSMYLIGIAVAVLSAVILKFTVLKGGTPPFIMELPAYHPPRIKNTLVQLWGKLKHFLFKAATVIAGAAIIIWFLSSFSFRFSYTGEAGDSMLAVISKALRWLFVPLGFAKGDSGWMFVASVFTGLVAKELVVSSLGIFAGAGATDAGGTLTGTPLAALIGGLSAPAAFSFMAFNLLTVPCMAAVAAAKTELGGKKRLLAAIIFWIAAAYAASALIYWIGTYWWLSLVFAAALLIVFTVIYNLKKRKTKCGGCAGCSRADSCAEFKSVQK